MPANMKIKNNNKQASKQTNKQRKHTSAVFTLSKTAPTFAVDNVETNAAPSNKANNPNNAAP